MNIKYDPDKTILKCTKCGQEQVEWYNDQPGDPCSNYKPNCNGDMVRIMKILDKNPQITSVIEFQNQMDISNEL
jgi:ssDNA-binding Zn-finger/Zn-ribbon topoisomerase 1